MNNNWISKMKITKVEQKPDGYALRFGGNAFLLPTNQNPDNIVPKEGDQIEIKLFSSFVAGVKINGQVLFEMNDADLEAEAKKVAAGIDQNKKDLFSKMETELDSDYVGLPQEFKDRIDQFRKKDPDYRWKHEIYEMAILKAAIAIHKKYKTEDEIVKFKQMEAEERIEQIPEVFDHSDNMVGFACLIAACYIVHPEEIINIPASHVPFLKR